MVEMLLIAIMQLLLQTTAPTIYDLAPLVVIFILIIAAAGLTRGSDIFSLFGIATLVGLTKPGGGGAGKGFSTGRTRPKVQAQASALSTKSMTSLGKTVVYTAPANAYLLSKKPLTPSEKAEVAQAAKTSEAKGYGTGTDALVKHATMGLSTNNRGLVGGWRRFRVSSAGKTLSSHKADAYAASAVAAVDVRNATTWSSRRRAYKSSSLGTWYVFPILYVPLPHLGKGGSVSRAQRAQQKIEGTERTRYVLDQNGNYIYDNNGNKVTQKLSFGGSQNAYDRQMLLLARAINKNEGAQAPPMHNASSGIAPPVLPPTSYLRSAGALLIAPYVFAAGLGVRQYFQRPTAATSQQDVNSNPARVTVQTPQRNQQNSSKKKNVIEGEFTIVPKTSGAARPPANLPPNTFMGFSGMPSIDLMANMGAVWNISRGGAAPSTPPEGSIWSRVSAKVKTDSPPMYAFGLIAAAAFAEVSNKIAKDNATVAQQKVTTKTNKLTQDHITGPGVVEYKAPKPNTPAFVKNYLGPGKTQMTWEERLNARADRKRASERGEQNEGMIASFDGWLQKNESAKQDMWNKHGTRFDSFLSSSPARTFKEEEQIRTEQRERQRNIDDSEQAQKVTATITEEERKAEEDRIRKAVLSDSKKRNPTMIKVPKPKRDTPSEDTRATDPDGHKRWVNRVRYEETQRKILYEEGRNTAKREYEAKGPPDRPKKGGF